MGSPRLLLFHIAAALSCSVAAGEPLARICGRAGNYTPASPYQDALLHLARSLPGTTSSSSQHFASATAGAIPDASIAVAFCRGDADDSACRGCVAASFHDALQMCPYNKGATIFHDFCQLKFSNEDFVASADGFGDFDAYTSDANERAPPEEFDDGGLDALLQAVVNYTSTTPLRYGTGVRTGTMGYTYALAQCQPTMAQQSCSSCLSYLLERMPPSFRWKPDGRMRQWRCFIQFDDYRFFTLDPAIHQVPDGKRKKHKKVVIIILIIVAVLLPVFTVTIVLLLRNRKQRKGTRKELGQAQSHDTSKTEATLNLWRTKESEFTLYEFSDLVAATANFSEQNRLGSGGFGTVYKGKLQSGTEIAVKRLASYSKQGLEQFKNEVQLLVKLQHTNLVRLVGCCAYQQEKLLIYEYMPNGSLDHIIFDQQRGLLLDWERRMCIVQGIAEGLLYLHKHSRMRVIHRDLKASNILLDSDLNPKISDFGLAKIFPSNLMEVNSKRIVGTFGYMAPEYASEGTFSVKSDVYSFGVLLLEIVSGKRNNDPVHNSDFITMIDYAWQLWREGRESELIDPRLGMCGEVATVMLCIKLALLCVQDSVTDRPTMSDVIVMLAARDGAAFLPDPKPPQRSPSSAAITGVLEMQTQLHPTTCSVNNVSVTTLHGR